MNALTTFDFENNAVRTTDTDGEVWFVGKDVCKCLEHGNHNQVLSRLDEDERKGVHIVDPIGRNQTMVCINEPGLYNLILTSRTDAAKRFKRWVTHEVLPAIRKTGQYSMPQMDPNFERRRLDLEISREARMLWGKEVAQKVWIELGLPTGPQDAPSNDNEKRFLVCLEVVTLVDKPVSASKHAINFAPRIFVRMPDAEGVTLSDLTRTMHDMLDKGSIIQVPYGPGKRCKRIVKSNK